MKKYIYLAAAALMLAACTDDENTTATDVALKVNAAISGISTRASGTTWAEGDRIGITTTSRTLTQYTNIAYAYDGTTFIAEGAGIYFQDPAEVTFNAYYPCAGQDGTAAGTIAKTITADDQTADKQPQIDFLFATGATGSKENSTVNFTGNAAFKHRMSQISIVFANGADVNLTGTLTAYTLGGLTMEGTFDTGTGVATATGTQTAALAIALSGVTTTEGKYAAAPLIVYPQTATSAPISVVVEGETYTTTLIIPEGELQAGNNYVFPVTVSKTGLTVGTVEISGWTDVQGDGATATM